MKMFKSSMVWALAALFCVAQDASAGRFIVCQNTIEQYDAGKHLKPITKKDHAAGELFRVSPMTGVLSVWSDRAWRERGYVVDVPSINTVQELQKLALDSSWASRWSGTWEDAFTPEHLAQKDGKRVSFLEERAAYVADRMKKESEQAEEESDEAFLARTNAVWEKFKPIVVELKKQIESLLDDQTLSGSFEESYLLFCYLLDERVNSCIYDDYLKYLEIRGKIEDIETISEESRSDDQRARLAELKKQLALVDAPKPADAPEPADDKDKKSEVTQKGLQERFMSINAGYRYAGANVAILIIASMLQAMQDGYRGVDIEAKDVTEQLSMKKKAVRALAAVVSLKKHASNVSALYRVVRPQSEKGVVSPKFLARATQFAKNKPFIVAGLLGVTALNTYGVYSHAGDIKMYAGELGTKAKGLVTKKTA